MLSEAVADHKAIVSAMRDWHRNHAAPPVGIGITAAPGNNVWDIQYGSYGVAAGSIRMNRNNFEVTHVTNALGAFVTFVYNHVWGGTPSSATFSAALSCPDLSGSDSSRSLIILMTSESARSILVRKYVTAVLSNAAMTAGDFATVTALTAEYAHTQVHVGGTAGHSPGWTALTGLAHRAYNQHKANQNVVNHLAGVNTLYDKVAPF